MSGCNVDYINENGQDSQNTYVNTAIKCDSHLRFGLLTFTQDAMRQIRNSDLISISIFNSISNGRGERDFKNRESDARTERVCTVACEGKGEIGIWLSVRPNKKNCLVVLQWSKKDRVRRSELFFLLFFFNTALWKLRDKASYRQWLMFKVVTWC